MLRTAKETTVLGMLGDLQRFRSALAANVADLSHLEGGRTKLEAIVDEAQEVVTQQAALTARKQEVSKQLKTRLDEGLRLATVLRLAVKEHYGIRSEKLVEFGLQPFRGRPRRARAVPATPTPVLPVLEVLAADIPPALDNSLT